MDFTKPIKLESARAWRTYIGGRLIEELHGNKNAEDSNFPEEWLMSTVTARNAGRENIVEGLSITEYGVSLKELIDKSPKDILGEKHYKTYGSTTGVLVKLLDSAERLTVQVHPTREKAKMLFNSEYGKTECWYILNCRNDICEKPCIYLGFKEGVTKEKWKECFDKQDINSMLNMLHCFEVKPGETYLIKGGVPHAIGAGCFLTEIQEPTDYTVRTEKTTPSGRAINDFMCHQGLGFEKMFDCFDYKGMTASETLDSYKIKPITNKTEEYTESEVIGYRDTEMFCLKVISINKEYCVKKANSFSGIYILDGEGTVADRRVQKGDQFFIPASAEDFCIKSSNGLLKVIQYFGPRTDL